MDNAIEQIIKLLSAIDEALKDTDLTRAAPGLSIFPGGDLNLSDSNAIGITFQFNGNIFESPEQRKYDSAFDELISSMNSQDKSREKLQELLSEWEDDD